MRSIIFSALVLSACAAQQPTNTDAVKSSSEPAAVEPVATNESPEKATTEIAPSDVAPVALDGSEPVAPVDAAADPAAAPTDPTAAPSTPEPEAKPAEGTETKDGSDTTVD